MPLLSSVAAAEALSLVADGKAEGEVPPVALLVAEEMLVRADAALIVVEEEDESLSASSCSSSLLPELVVEVLIGVLRFPFSPSGRVYSPEIKLPTTPSASWKLPVLG